MDLPSIEAPVPNSPPKSLQLLHSKKFKINTQETHWGRNAADFTGGETLLIYSKGTPKTGNMIVGKLGYHAMLHLQLATEITTSKSRKEQLVLYWRLG